MIPLVWPHFHGCGAGDGYSIPQTIVSEGPSFTTCGLGGDCRSWASLGCDVISTACYS